MRPSADRIGAAIVPPGRGIGPEEPTTRQLADVLRGLACASVQPGRTGRACLPLGMADAATVLWTRFQKFDAADPRWPDRDRFVLSAGHGSLLLYALLHLSGHAGMGRDELRKFRQPDAAAAAHPSFGQHPAIETTTGPLAQGLGNAVGMALAERLLAARFGRSLVDHRTWVVASDGDLMEGLSHEAASLAGHLQLGRLTVLWDDNRVCRDGDVALSSSDDPLRRFASYGWAVRRVDGHDATELAAALAMAVRSPKPTLIACRTTLGTGTGTGSAEAGLPYDVPAALATSWALAGARGSAARRAWLKRLARHPMRAEFERVMAARLPESLHEALAGVRASFAATRPALATRAASQRVLEAIVPALPELLGGSADLTASNLTRVAGMGRAAPGSFSGRYVHWGIREHGMAAAMNGIAVHGGLIPYGGTFVVFSDYMRPALRLAALMRQRVIHVLTQDGGDRSDDGGDEGPTLQPYEHLASLRAVPNLFVFRPADAIETAECWELALKRVDGPSLLALSRQPVPSLRPPGPVGENRSARGGYVLAEADGPRHATLVATGPEVATAMEARRTLAAEGLRVAVVSLPCWECFARTDEAYRSQVLGAAPRIGVEAAGDFGWERWLGPDGVFLGFVEAPACPAGRLGAREVAEAVRRRVAV